MIVEDFINVIGVDFYSGVPDSQLKALCNYLNDTYGNDSRHHIIAANEGNAVALATGYHLATGKVPVVYMQNSGEGNIINPVASLLHEKVYGIPMIFVVGWRGEPGIHDEPQHIFQGEVTLKLLEDMNIAYCVIDKDTDRADIEAVMQDYRQLLSEGRNVAFVIRKGALEYKAKKKYSNNYEICREEIIECIVKHSEGAPVISTTGKASRELFEIRERNNTDHNRDFLTVGSMGHSSSIALGVALNKQDTKVWCIDGDGAMLMHMGAMAVIGANKPGNLIHILINNEAHETVGGMPTAAGRVDACAIAKGCGYEMVYQTDNCEELEGILEEVKRENKLSFIEVKAALGARDDLGRPTTKARDNKEAFMNYLKAID